MHSMLADPQIGVASSSKNERHETNVLFLSTLIFTRHMVGNAIAFFQCVVGEAFQLAVLLRVAFEEKKMALRLQITLPPVRIVIL